LTCWHLALQLCEELQKICTQWHIPRRE
jgi:hypothetical protein